MKEKLIQLAKGFSFPAVKFATRGNAVIGIRNTGKTVTATKTAECLMDVGIPFIAFDPVGVWKNLKIGANGNKGYPVVVAGAFKDADIHLTPENAVSIVLAAMKANVNLVLDLHHPTLANKSTWRKIVSDSLEALMQENLNYGPRHIFLEEGAEFAPQRIMPGQAMVYSTVERLARMGRNMGLGYTIINQRAEEVNKAILEICEITLLHKQVGKNSMLSIQKWLDVREIKNRKEILKTLPHLAQGECWVIGEGESGLRIKVLSKKTFHPNTDEGITAMNSGQKPLNVSEFVRKLNEALKSQQSEAALKTDKINNFTAAAIDKNITLPLEQEIIRLTNENDYLKETLKSKEKEIDAVAHAYETLIDKINLYTKNIQSDIESIEPEIDSLRLTYPLVPISSTKPSGVHATDIIVDKNKGISPIPPSSITRHDKNMPLSHSTESNTLSKSARTILMFLANIPSKAFSKAQISVGSGYSITSSGFINAISELNVKGYLTKHTNGRIQLNPEKDISFLGKITPSHFSIGTFAGKLDKCPRELLQELLSNPRHWYDRNELSKNTGYSINSSGFLNGISKLNTLELIAKNGQSIRINQELLEL